MATITDILYFAATNSQFTRKELIAYLEKQKQTVSPNALSIQLDRLLKSNELTRIERGVYALPATSHKNFIAFISDEIKQLNLQLKTQFPFADFCVWSSKTIAPYMHHIPNLNYIYIDVERDVTESVFDYLNGNSSIRVFLCPNLDDFSRYINGNDSIIVRTLISEAPLQVLDGFNTPTLEKILVDVVGDVEFDFLQGTEITYFYSNVIERHNLNTNKLLRYATRRGRKEEVEQLLNNNKL
ncbi:MAG: type IV toxin-antitoxin system AbiEi family antitoxin domain-containing protein [Paludibacter sp.]